MKPKHLILFALLLGAGLTPALAQSDSVLVEDTVVYSTDDLSFMEDVPVAGDFSLNKLMGVVVGKKQYSRHFFELTLPFGYLQNDRMYTRGWGAHYAYLPKHWGFYGEATYDRLYFNGSDGDLYFYPSGQAAAGVAFRPILEESKLDWQLFAGAAAGGLGLGYEVGTRFALGSKSNTARFSWLSGSLSMMSTTQGMFFTLGLSIGASFAALIFLE